MRNERGQDAKPRPLMDGAVEPFVGELAGRLGLGVRLGVGLKVG